MYTQVAKKCVFLLGLMSCAACTNTQTTPTMLDFSYIPPQYSGTGVTAYNTLEDF